MKRVLINVTGKVQGVCFRRSAQSKANELGITGYVMNNDNGSVNILAQGAFPAVDNLIEWCSLGSPQSQVDQVYVQEDEENEIYLDFSILPY
ncbi:acylphosphatase [Shewanella sp. D64]|uniref:acylphosphatase n=1 Tax=unclassified Shewanella TaxID=196818 RepID=UPI0022BA57D5|nr:MULTISPECIES: acylphosphatase [unclassified Shewanella]MEC4725684.1 acylphosphatase [Shewanella sp. D64]MEC4737709.1 acylphosphatase [Shewanella sp. E94]WBJ98207.1 acylphosphatase [Shewanella sp. MTB7]